MSNFRTKIMGLAAMATAFAGVSFGQALTCTDTTNNAPGPATVPQINSALRVEGQTEQLSLLQFACTGTASAAGTTTATITITTNLTITSKAVGLSNEATLITDGTTTTITGGVVTLGNGVATAGVVSGNTVTFNNVSIPVSVAGTTTFFAVTNIRVNASAAPSTPYQTTESGLIAYTTSTTTGPTTAYTAIPATNSSGLIVQSLGAPKITAGTNNYTTCVGNPGPNFTLAGPPSNPSFTLNINQIISGAFLTNGPPPVGEGGQYAPGGGSAVGTGNADIISVTLSGLPASATVYVPASVTVTSGANSTTLSITLPTAPAATITLPAGDTPGATFSVSSAGTVTIPYTVSAFAGLGAPANSNFAIPVVVAFAANSVTTPTIVTANYSYSPTSAALTGPASAVPTFVASSFTAANGSAISLCQTTMLFPFITNQLGYDTGIAIANTSTDNLGLGGKSAATAQTGTCTLFLYGPTAPSSQPVTGIPDPQGPLASGSTHAFQLSSIAPGYQGYAIAVCPFNYAHAFAFLFDNAGAASVAQGYLAEVFGTNDRGQNIGSGDAAITF